MQPQTSLKRDYPYIKVYLYTALFGLLLGILLGPLQGMDKAGINLYPYLPLIKSYYQGLTLHGVSLALIWTSFFILAFLNLALIHGLKRPLRSPGLNRLTVVLMLAGMIMAIATILTNKATVMFTAYAPLKAHPLFYIGLALFVVIGSWIFAVNAFLTYRDWRKEHPREKLPLLAFGTLVALAMWVLSTFGIAVEFVVFLIPWSLGLVEEIDPLLTRSLFWFTGHPIVYWWLLPAYISWYFILPKQVGGKLFSESMARLALLLFIPFSLPVGFHHMYTDPGVSMTSKFVHFFLTFVVFVPSMITAFTVVASLESGGRNRGGKGWLGWIPKLPWNDPSVAAQLLSMFLFALGGIMGLVNASYSLNLLVHNTLYIVSHFHLTVGTAASLTYIGLTYWVLPLLTGKKLWSQKIGVWQVWLWFFGMAFLGRGLAMLGLEGAPRRTWMALANYELPGAELAGFLSAVGGIILFVSTMLYFYNVIMTVFFQAEPAGIRDIPLAEPMDGGLPVPGWLDRLKPWVVTTVFISAIAWGPMLWQILMTPSTMPGMTPW